MDRTLAMAFGVSLACHLVLLGAQLLDLRWIAPAGPQHALDIIYEYQLAEQELARLQHQLAELAEPPKLTEFGESPGASGGVGGGLSHIRIPDRPLAEGAARLPGASTTRSAVVDLTNLVDAAQGDPVLLSYFSAIREQIQRAANQQTWMAGEPDAQGLVYVSFVLGAAGKGQAVSIVADRSIPSRQLQDIAMRIVKAASPFAPFPPSLADASKTVVVPLEFLRGS